MTGNCSPIEDEEESPSEAFSFPSLSLCRYVDNKNDVSGSILEKGPFCLFRYRVDTHFPDLGARSAGVQSLLPMERKKLHLTPQLFLFSPTLICLFPSRDIIPHYNFDVAVHEPIFYIDDAPHEEIGLSRHSNELTFLMHVPYV